MGGWGAGLTYLGEGIGDIMTRLRQQDTAKKEEERKRQQDLVDTLYKNQLIKSNQSELDLKEQKQKSDLDEKAQTQKHEEEARNAISQVNSSVDKYNNTVKPTEDLLSLLDFSQMKTTEGISNTGNPLEDAKSGLSDKLPENQYADIERAKQLGQQKPYERVMSIADKIVGTEAGDDYLKLLQKDPNGSPTGKYSGGTALAIQMSMHTPENIQKAKDLAKLYKDAGVFTDEQFQGLVADAENNSMGAITRMNQMAQGIQGAWTTKEGMIPINAKNTAATTNAGEQTKRDIQKNNPVLSEAQSNAISDSYSAVMYLNRLKNALQNNNLGYFDINRKTGQFTNPKAQDAFAQLVEIVGRKRSGAAISESEWGNFGKEILNKNNLLTDTGKEQAINGLDHYLDKFFASGANVTGDNDWYNKYNDRAKTARKNAELKLSENTDKQNNTQQSPTWSSDKEKRYQELMAKKTAGTLR